jgi:hypothetical protein
LSTTTDAVHLNERAGARIAALVEQLAREAVRRTNEEST